MDYLRSILYFLVFSLIVSTSSAQSDNAIFKILVHNVGGSDFHLVTEKFGSNCPSYKLCHKVIIDRVRSHFQEHMPDVVFYQEMQGIHQLLIGTIDNPAILPDHYHAHCAKGASNIYEVCTGWNSYKFELVEECARLESGAGGVLKCTLRSLANGKKIDFINLHPSAFNAKDRIEMLDTVWTKLVNKDSRTLVAGDFNTTNTYPADSKYPYPSEFGTAFGRTEKKYGRWPAKEYFYGYRKVTPDGSIRLRKVAGSTVINRKIDHLFLNFGELPNDPQSLLLPCKNNVCLGNIDGYDWGIADWATPPLFGPMTDHLPILANIEF